MTLFERIDPPANANLPDVDNIKWFTFDSDFYKLLPQLKNAFKKHGPPIFVHSRKSKQYNYSFHVELKKIDPSLVDDLSVLANSLKRVKVGKGLNFYSGLINNRISGDLFQFLFSYLRASLVRMNNDDLSSLYPPLTVTNNEDDFPLHCDLYIPKILFNVFEESAPGKLGASHFITTNSLLKKYLPSISSINQRVIRKADQLLNNERGTDRYEDFYSLLYDDEKAWSSELRDVLFEHSICQKFIKGQGYMINDRVWMHGRGATKGMVNGKRLHRLVFNNSETTLQR